MKKILEDDFEFRTKTIYLSKQKATQIKQNLEPNFIYNSTPRLVEQIQAIQRILLKG